MKITQNAERRTQNLIAKILLLFMMATNVWAEETKPGQMPGMDNKAAEQVTVTGEVKDKVPLERIAPPTDLPLREAIPFTTQQEIERILKGEIEHLDPAEQVRLMNVKSPRPYYPTLVEFPKPPYFAMAYPFGSDSPAPATEIKSWTFEVVNEQGEPLHRQEGQSIPVESLIWDGYENGEFKLAVDRVYTAVLIVETQEGVRRTWMGEPVRLSVLKYKKDDNTIYDYSNKRLYEENRARFKKEISPYVQQLLNHLKRMANPRASIVLFDREPEASQAKARTQLWQQTFSTSLLKTPEEFSAKELSGEEAGELTRIVVPWEGGL